VISKRTAILLDQLRTLYVAARTARKERNHLRDDYAAMLAEAEAMLDALQSERDDLLARVNARLVADGEPEITLDYFKDLP
jgi:hypothetical protein